MAPSDPDGDPVTLRWVLESDAATYANGVNTKAEDARIEVKDAAKP